MPNILIVEDDKAIANLIQLNLTVAGYQSEWAHSGYEAELALEGRGFDLVLLDVMLPYMEMVWGYDYYCARNSSWAVPL